MDDKLRQTVNDHYQRGQGSIQDIARVYRLTVDEVLEAIGMDDMATVNTMGDLIGQEEAGFDVPLNKGNTHKVPFTTD